MSAGLRDPKMSRIGINRNKARLRGVLGIRARLVLFALTLLLNLVARFLVWRVARRVPTEARA